ncbi:hypothetical protein V5799_029465 [Amblyomma americanum]|uniref:B9 domain-containing protein 2 n=1 Tax=Amblyomma americanum TaxID=6943 RepID=A0AAQ4ERA8_AMBAM
MLRSVLQVELEIRENWTLLEGSKEGQTQVDRHRYDDNRAVWCHPVDVHFSTRGIQDWPKLVVQVWHQDDYGRNELIGYGSCHLPSSPGFAKVDCATWRPVGTLLEEVSRQFLGGGLHLRDPEEVLGRVGDRFRLRTEAMGTVHLELYAVHRDFHKYGIEA